MHFNIGKKKEKPKNRNWFAWFPVVAKDRDDCRYIVWLEQVFRGRTVDFYSYYLIEGRTP